MVLDPQPCPLTTILKLLITASLCIFEFILNFRSFVNTGLAWTFLAAYLRACTLRAATELEYAHMAFIIFLVNEQTLKTSIMMLVCTSVCALNKKI